MNAELTAGSLRRPSLSQRAARVAIGGVLAAFCVFGPGCFTQLADVCVEQSDCTALESCVSGVCVSSSSLTDVQSDSRDDGASDVALDSAIDADVPDVDDDALDAPDGRPDAAGDADDVPIDSDAPGDVEVGDVEVGDVDGGDAEPGSGPEAPLGFVWIPPGTLSLGSPAGELGRDVDELPHNVTLTNGFFASATELTQGEWTALSGGVNPALHPDCGEACPVEGIDWFSALAYANARSAADGYEPCYRLEGCDDTAGWTDGVHSGCDDAEFAGASCGGYRLPSEAEWEYAARATTLTATYAGDLQPATEACSSAQPALDRVAWWCANSGSTTHRVAQREPNAWGLYDVLGNVWEWTGDAYGPYPPGTVADPVVAVGPLDRPVARGASFGDEPALARSAYRNRSAETTDLGGNLGVRLVRTAGADERPPVVVAPAVIQVGARGVSLTATIQSLGTPALDAAGFCVGPPGLLSCHGRSRATPCAPGTLRVAATEVPDAVGRYTADLGGLEPLTPYSACAYASSAAGLSLTVPISFETLTTPPPQVVGVAASTDRSRDVLVSWTPQDETPAYYEVSVDGGPWQVVRPDSPQFTDSFAPPPTLTACSVSAGDGTSVAAVEVSCLPEPTVLAGAERSYRVRAVNAGGAGLESAAVVGFRSGGSASVRWERSSTDAATGFAVVPSLTGSRVVDSTPPVGSGRFYRALIEGGEGVAGVTTAPDRGFRGSLPVVQSSAPTGVTASSAGLGGLLVSLGAPVASGVGACLGPPDAATCEGISPLEPCAPGFTQVVLSPTPGVAGAFAVTVSSLESATRYSFCAYASNAAGTAYSPLQVFSTSGGGAGSVPLGELCTTDAECIAEAWCPIGTTERRCAPFVGWETGEAMALLYVPAGTFTMGSPISELSRGTNEDQVAVTLSRALFAGRTEVTQGQWKELAAGVNPACYQSTTIEGCSTANANDDAPVERVDWYSAVAYVNALSRSEGLPECYALENCDDPDAGWRDGLHSGCTGADFVGLHCEGYRLLTEAEWERAARAGSSAATYGGNLSETTGCAITLSGIGEIPSGTEIGELGWYLCNSGNRTQPVATRRANSWGFHDMLGNVYEFTSDTYSDTLLGGVDPAPTGAGDRTLRNGGFFSGPLSMRAAHRNGLPATARNGGYGFRVGRTAPAPAAADSSGARMDRSSEGP